MGLRREFAKRRAMLGLAASLVGPAGCSAPPPQTCTLTLATSVPLRPGTGGDLLLVPVSIKGASFNLFIDTGATTTLVSVKTMRADEWHNPAFLMSLRGAGGASTAAIARVHDVQIGRLHDTIYSAEVNFSGNFVKQNVVGNLGTDITGNYDVDLDVWGGHLRLYDTQGHCRTTSTALDAPFYTVDYLPTAPSDNRPHVPVEIAGHRFSALVDTGSTRSTLSAGAARVLGLSAAMLRGDREVGVAAFGPNKVKAHVHVLDSVAIGDLTMHHVPMLVDAGTPDPSSDLLLGLDLATRVHLWLSNSSRRMLMQFPPKPSPALQIAGE